MDQVMALVWVGAGAVAIGAAGASWSRVAAATARVWLRPTQGSF